MEQGYLEGYTYQDTTPLQLVKTGVGTSATVHRGAPTLLSFPTILSFPTNQLSVRTAHIKVPTLCKFLATVLQATQTMSHTSLVRGGWVQEGSRCKLLQPKILKVAARVLEQGGYSCTAKQQVASGYQPFLQLILTYLREGEPGLKHATNQSKDQGGYVTAGTLQH